MDLCFQIKSTIYTEDATGDARSETVCEVREEDCGCGQKLQVSSFEGTENLGAPRVVYPIQIKLCA